MVKKMDKAFNPKPAGGRLARLLGRNKTPAPPTDGTNPDEHSEYAVRMEYRIRKAENVLDDDTSTTHRRRQDAPRNRVTLLQAPAGGGSVVESAGVPVFEFRVDGVVTATRSRPSLTQVVTTNERGVSVTDTARQQVAVTAGQTLTRVGVGGVVQTDGTVELRSRGRGTHSKRHCTAGAVHAPLDVIGPHVMASRQGLGVSHALTIRRAHTLRQADPLAGPRRTPLDSLMNRGQHLRQIVEVHLQRIRGVQVTIRGTNDTTLRVIRVRTQDGTVRHHHPDVVVGSRFLTRTGVRLLTQTHEHVLHRFFGVRVHVPIVGEVTDRSSAGRSKAYRPSRGDVV